jgi:hypothetical protein
MYITPFATASDIRTSTGLGTVILLESFRHSEAKSECSHIEASVLHAEWSMSKPSWYAPCGETRTF